MKELIGYCGLDCEQCDARIATVNNDEALREKTAKLWSRLNGAESKGMETCGSCDRLDGCETVGAIISGNPQAMDNLKKKILHI